MAGGEFGTDGAGFSNAAPGIYGATYRYDPPQTFRALARRGIRLVRLPFRWERVQPQLGGELDPAEVERIRETVAAAHAAGLVVVLDLHNFGEYRTAAGSARLGQRSMRRRSRTRGGGSLSPSARRPASSATT